MRKNTFQKFLDGEIMIQVKTNEEYRKLIDFLKNSDCIGQHSEVIYPYYFYEDPRVNFIAIKNKTDNKVRNYKIVAFDNIAKYLIGR